LAQGNLQKISTRLQGLDSLRGMAALAVVLYHYTFGFTQVVGKHMPGLDLMAIDGHFGIYLFFIISGFVIFMTLERSARAADFSVSRFARLWPPYLVCAGLTSLLIVVLDFNPIHLTVGDALPNVLMMNKVLGNVSMTLFGPAWNPGALKQWQFMLLTAVFAVVVWLVAERKIRFLNIAPLLFLGEISYSLYLVHQIAGYWVIKQLEAVGWDPDHAIWVAVVCAIVVATCVRTWIEVPAQKAIRGWYQGTREESLVTAS
jgi:peptidoglycan/LPS O-acetylase OafA/YrhL